MLLKYKSAYAVTVNGEKLGYITNIEEFEKSLDDIVNKPEENKLYTTLGSIIEYKSVLINRIDNGNKEEILSKIEEKAETTYKIYAVTVDSKEKAKVTNLAEAEALAKELNKKYEKDLGVKVAIVEVITNNKKDGVVEIKTAKADISKELSKKLDDLNAKKAAEEEARRIEEENYRKWLESTETTTEKTTTTKNTTTKVASLNGVNFTVTPVSGTITSRFGSRESIRSSGHSGLDIAAPKGTKIKVAASGTVIFAGYSGGYGNVVKVSHGSGIVTYYAHCSEIYVSKGDKVTAGDVVAAVGSTGFSTGNHLHFEVVKDGVSVNPQNYLYKNK